MKKLFFILLLCLCLFFILEIISYNFLYGFFRQMNDYGPKEFISNYKLYGITPQDILTYDIILPERNNETLNYDNNKRPILTIGCSYTYGQGININKTFASQLQKKTNRKVLNVSMLGAGSDDVIRYLSYMNKINALQKNWFKYVFYTCMYAHVHRIYDLGLFSDYISDILQQNKNNSLKDKIKYYLNKSYTFKILNSKKYANSRDFEMSFNYLKYNISKMNKIIKSALPDSIFVVLLYDDITNSNDAGEEEAIPLEKNNYTDLTNEDINFIETKELVGDILYKEEYQLPYDTFQYWRPHHPNEKAWEMIVPQLCKKLKL